MSNANFQTREQRYADAVYTLVDEYRKQQQKLLKETDQKKREDELKAACKPYGAMAHKLPVLIRTAGLAQTLAFLQARHKDGTQQRVLLDHLTKVLGKDDLVKLSREASVGEYMVITNEVLAALLWFKRYAQSVLNVYASDEGEPR